MPRNYINKVSSSVISNAQSKDKCLGQWNLSKDLSAQIRIDLKKKTLTKPKTKKVKIDMKPQLEKVSFTAMQDMLKEYLKRIIA